MSNKNFMIQYATSDHAAPIKLHKIIKKKLIEPFSITDEHQNLIKVYIYIFSRLFKPYIFIVYILTLQKLWL
jgi:hypothetical protein